MSRYGDENDYDEDFPNQAALWQANFRRALKGKRGRQALGDLRDALLALPEPRLIEGALCTVDPDMRSAGMDGLPYAQEYLAENVEDQGGGGVCAIGALLWHRKVKAGMDPAEAFGSLPTLLDSENDLDDTARLAASDAGLVYSLAWNLAYRNDETFEGMTPEERHAAFLRWIGAELGDGETAGIGAGR